MNNTRLPTAYAPAERVSPHDAHRQFMAFAGAGLWQTLLDAQPPPIVILNRQRQIVLANQAMRELVACDSQEQLIGLRPGEAMRCVHAAETAGGCGTTRFCQTCGAVNAILSSQQGRRAVEECRITAYDGALDLRISAVPVEAGGGCYTIFSIMDISHEKRRRKLERLFFHDILNLAVGLRGFVELDARARPASAASDGSPLVVRLASQLIEEINAQKDLAAAEHNDLTVRPTRIETRALLESVADLYRHHPVAGERRIALDAVDVALETDPVLLRRILGNLIKNALEASPASAAITLGCDADEQGVRFRVHNPGVMPDAVQRQIFQRSFSTKGPDRGLGTYSVKLLAEHYLHGKVTFLSASPGGTVFLVYLPRAWPSS